ncbi:MAG: thioredoxin domain-containing protein [Burkholderiales bacterium]|nr:thioredoxin domain-containing protein [Burkholderiales bacterium]
MPNRLARETSPYLRQHAGNPVDWYPWGAEALERARREDRPILLSIGYSACHWCHVMAHESFEDEAVAAVMNRLFVNIKVDREERPDLDQIYQIAHQLFSRRPGGWPLTVFMSPEQVPFFVGTYFPKEPRFKLPGFAELCERAGEAWRQRRGDIAGQKAALAEAFARLAPPRGSDRALPDEGPLAAALAGLKEGYDPVHGGFGSAPKFPHPAELEFCLRRGTIEGDAAARQVALHTLERMALGGIFDQLGGGFARYSVDAGWTVPHFEKMLHDNGALLGLYAEAWRASGNPLFRWIAEQTADWLVREMQSPEGGYYSSVDADSEGEEGRYYLWDREEIRRLVPPQEYALAELHWGLEAPPNFEGRLWHLNVRVPREALPARIGLTEDACALRLASLRSRLLAVRARRERPATDTKVLTAWNALAIAGMARAASTFGRPEWLASARRAFDFLRASMWREGRLLASWMDGRAQHNAYLDDYAYLLAASLELAQAQFDPAAIDFARALAEALIERFEDRENGGFYFTSHDHEALLARLKLNHDGPTPSGNGVAVLALLRLSWIGDTPRFARAAERALECFAPALADAPAANVSLLAALEERLRPPRIVVLRGPQGSLDEWRERVARTYLPRTLLFSIPNDARGLPPALGKPASDNVNAWVCEGVACLAPIDSLEQLAIVLSSKGQKV